MGNQNTLSTRYHVEIYNNVALAATIISAVASAILIVLIWKISQKRWPITMMTLFAMAVLQLLYDVSFYTAVAPVANDSVNIVTNILQIVGGIGSSLYSNASAFITLYVISKKLLLKRNVFTYISIFSMGVSFLNATIWVVGYTTKNKLEYEGDTMYYWIRLISIFVNFVLYFVTYLVVRRLLNTKTKNDETRKFNEALIAITNRLKYYPLIQALSRSGLAVYEFIYGFNFNPQGKVSPFMFGLQIYAVIITPAASVGYLIIFLVMQPNAYKIFCKSFFCYNYTQATDDNSLSDCPISTKKSNLSSIKYADYDDRGTAVTKVTMLGDKNAIVAISNSTNSMNDDDGGNNHNTRQSDMAMLARFSSFVNNRFSVFDIDERDDDVLCDIIASGYHVEEYEISNSIFDSSFK